MGPRATPSFPFEDLPGEIKNQIFNLCIADARSRYKQPRTWATQSGLRSEPERRAFNFMTHQPSAPIPRPLSRPPVEMKVSVLPGWAGAGKIQTLGIGSLPLLFVNKQIYEELSSIIDSHIEEISIGPYGVQYSNEDPNIRWEIAYALLRNRPYLRRNVKIVKLFLPWLRPDWLKFHLKFLGNTLVQENEKSYGLTVIPNLVECLQTFEQISKIDILLVAETRAPPNMEQLLPLYDLCGSATKVEIINIVQPLNRLIVAPALFAGSWVDAWDICLLEERSVVKDR